MKTNQGDSIQRGMSLFFVACFFYLLLAYTIFSFRHPWATRTESIIYTWEAVTFQKVAYETMRPRELK